jgi:hypothetical protein
VRLLGFRLLLWAAIISVHPQHEGCPAVSYQTKFGYLCRCGSGAECTEIAWHEAGRPRAVDCWHCGQRERWRQLDLAPLRATLDDISAAPWGSAAGCVLFIAMAVLLYSGWLGRILGIAAILFSAAPPHG